MITNIQLGILLVLTGIFASFVQASTGFGFSIIIMAIWPFFMPVTDAVYLQLVAGLVAVGYIAIKDWKHINFKIIWIPLIIALFGSYLGLAFLLQTPNAKAVLLLGFLFILLSIYFIVFGNKISVPNKWYTAGIAGICSGLMSGFFNIAGPPVVLYYNVACKSKTEYRATLQFFFMILIIFKITVMSINQSFSYEIIKFMPFVAAASVLGIFIGSKVFVRLPVHKLKRAVYILMSISGIWYIVEYFI